MKPERSMTELVAAIRGGDQDAFTELYNRTSQEVYRSARAVLRDEDEALDVQQDTFVYAYQHLDQLSDPEKLRPWLRSIAMNRAKSVLRRNTPVLFTELENDEGEGLPEQADLSPDASPELSLERKETAELVNEILGELSDGQRAAIAMYYYEQMTASEIADALGVATGTVKSQLARGKKKIEDAVHALEKKGVKLYGLSPMAFLVALMKKQAPTAQAGQAVLAKTLASAGLSAGAKTAAAAGAGAAAVPVAETVVLHATRPFFSTVVGKLVLGVICAGVVGGGVAGYNWAKDKLAPKVSPILYVDSAENLTKDPTTPTLPVELNPEDPTAPTLPAELETDEPVAPETTEPVVTEPEETEPEEEFIPDSSWPTGSCGEALTWYYNADEGELTITGSGEMDHYPGSEGKRGEDDTPWGAWFQEIKSVRVLDGVTSIGTFAFSDCSKLTSVTIPGSVTYIDSGAFYGCSSLTSVKLHAGLTRIGSNAFGGCSALESIKIPNGVTSIGEGAFNDCSALLRVALPDSVTSLGKFAFCRCASLTECTIPAGLSELGEKAFMDCPALEAIRVSPDHPDYSSVDGVLFDKAQTELIQYPSARQAERYEIPDGVTRIGDRAFEGCGALKSISIPDSVSVIGEAAFFNCGALTSVTIPARVTEIGEHTFNNCATLKSVTIPSGVTGIGDSAFASCAALRDVELPDSVEQIGEGAFVACTALTRITIPDKVKEIPAYTFKACTSLSEVTLPNGLQFIGDYAFENCKLLKSLHIPGSVNEIGCGAMGYMDDGEAVEGFTVYGKRDSMAQFYAEVGGLRFVAE